MAGRRWISISPTGRCSHRLGSLGCHGGAAGPSLPSLSLVRPATAGLEARSRLDAGRGRMRRFTLRRSSSDGYCDEDKDASTVAAAGETGTPPTYLPHDHGERWKLRVRAPPHCLNPSVTISQLSTPPSLPTSLILLPPPCRPHASHDAPPPAARSRLAVHAYVSQGTTSGSGGHGELPRVEPIRAPVEDRWILRGSTVVQTSPAATGANGLGLSAAARSWGGANCVLSAPATANPRQMVRTHEGTCSSEMPVGQSAACTKLLKELGEV